ncbi:hypothetical protein [Streptomyces resistomycificus]|uniref:hypothetical protein n=1 Tax=Streptomyces resistomycificus TaxID=67356 RepID=UPI00069120B3|nr:hypothetical protein [Streptomyces resistomycificus]KUN92147.1 hypothetical protein AQJ84_34580 [Streptomyces resistomycificus]
MRYIAVTFTLFWVTSFLIAILGAAKYFTSNGDPGTIRSAKSTVVYALVVNVLTGTIATVSIIFSWGEYNTTEVFWAVVGTAVVAATSLLLLLKGMLDQSRSPATGGGRPSVTMGGGMAGIFLSSVFMAPATLGMWISGRFGTAAALVVAVVALLFAISFLMLIFAGLRYVTSGGDSGTVSSAKNTMTYAFMGIIQSVGLFLALWATAVWGAIPALATATTITAVGVALLTYGVLLRRSRGAESSTADTNLYIPFGTSLGAYATVVSLTTLLFQISLQRPTTTELTLAGTASTPTFLAILATTIPKASSRALRSAMDSVAHIGAAGLPENERADFIESTRALLHGCRRRDRWRQMYFIVVKGREMASSRREVLARLDAAAEAILMDEVEKSLQKR